MCEIKELKILIARIKHRYIIVKPRNGYIPLFYKLRTMTMRCILLEAFHYIKVLKTPSYFEDNVKWVLHCFDIEEKFFICASQNHEVHKNLIILDVLNLLLNNVSTWSHDVCIICPNVTTSYHFSCLHLGFTGLLIWILSLQLESELTN